MEVDFFSNAVAEEDTVVVDVENDNFGGEGERCGICMDIVIDRGVLDCCQHWFCFVCIDNWATITNLCPLCQNEFQLITCVPVYDTIGSSKTDEDSDSRDDDWRVEGKNNTLSFPSYYIDENAVTCLDGDGCKLWSGSLTYEENSILDTSIACDSCDIWYHAFCVGFDADGTDIDTWLCPRCVVNQAENKSYLKDSFNVGSQVDSENADSNHLYSTISGNVFISVADAGETAVVVSRIHGEHFVGDKIVDVLQSDDSTIHHEVEQSVLGPDSSTRELKSSHDQGNTGSQQEPEVPPIKFHGFTVKSEPNEDDCRMGLDKELSLDANKSEDEKPKIVLGGDECLSDTSSRNRSKDESLEDIKANFTPKIGEKRKRTDYSFLTNDEDTHDEVGLTSGSSAAKVKAQQGIRRTSLIDKSKNPRLDDFQNISNKTETARNGIEQNVSAKDTSPIDIMSIVRGTESKAANRSMRQKEAGNCAKVENNAAKVRVKKIMRRPSDDTESADVVQKLRKEIREAVRQKPSDDFDKSIDPTLLAAFREAFAGSATGEVKKAPFKPEKLILQKGKTRENLTKKIYATSSGKRRRAWDRDCEVEFWKHRCLKTSKPEKIEALKSVLNHLRKNPETDKVEQNAEEESKAPLLSRLYLADASLFPRKNDIKPLSALKAASSKQNEEHCSEEDKKVFADNANIKTSGSTELPSQSNTIIACDKKNKSICTRMSNGVASGKLQADKLAQKKITGKTDDIKVDKRKWALEVLARKTASNSTKVVHQKQDNAILKGNYPLLAELPTDMWPKLAPIRHNKIPASVRQAQLYRLTEHLLKMANLRSIKRSATTELAVADATNIEKQVADRSNSKAVYLNLCSQEIWHCMDSSNSQTPVASRQAPDTIEVGQPSMKSLEPEPEDAVWSPISTEVGQRSTNSLEPEAEAALRAAGLLSDSPPSSPCRDVEDLHSDGKPVGEVKEEGMEDVLEMDSNPDLDIYGDFEYDLDEDFLAVSAIKPPEIQAADGESKVKVVFSTLNSSKTENGSDAKEQVSPKSGLPISKSSLPESLGHHATENNRSTANEADSLPKPADTCLDEGEELSLAECEALYGPEKEPLVKKFPELVLADMVTTQNVNNLELNSEDHVVAPDSCGNDAGKKPPSSSQSIENVQDRSSEPPADKKNEHTDSVLKKVEAYIKEHVRPLCKSGVITVEQYRWAVGKTTEKVMKYHTKAKNANFLIKEGEKVKKLAEQYVEAAKHKELK